MQMQPNFDLFERLENTPGNNDTKALLKTATEADKALLVLALDPDKKYNLQRFDEPPSRLLESADTTLQGFTELCNKLSSKKALTLVDRYYVHDYLSFCDQQTRKWYERVLLKDLKCDFGVSTLNKVWPNLIITHDCALAKEFDLDNPKHIKRLKDSLVDVKLDGVRCVAKVENGNVVLRSRNGKVLKNFPQIEEELKQLGDGVYDGEVYIPGVNAFQTLMKYLRSDEPIPDELEYRYYIFDIVNNDSYENRKNSVYKNAITNFDDWYYPGSTGGKLVHFGNRLGMTTLLDVESKDDLEKELDEVIAFGYEGLMIKDKNATYKAKRSDNILKLKRFHSSEAKVIGIAPGDQNGKYAHTVGSLVVENECGVFNIGSGLTELERDQFLVNPPIGRVVEYQYQELSKDGIPRFPTFLRFRVDQEVGL